MRNKLKICKTDFSQNREMWSCVKCITMFIIWQSSRGKSDLRDWFLPRRDFATVISRVFFVFESQQIQILQLKRVPHNKPLTNLPCSSRTGEYWPSVVLIGNSMRSVRILSRPRVNLPQYGPHAQLVRGYYKNSAQFSSRRDASGITPSSVVTNVATI